MLDTLLADRPLDNRRGSAAAPPDSDRGITFPMFLTLMGEHLYDFDTEAELLEAFESFDEGDTGVVRCDEMRKWLSDVGDRMALGLWSSARLWRVWRVAVALKMEQIVR